MSGPWLDDLDVRLYLGDAVERLRELPAGSVQTVVTSPPFWSLRDYGVEGQIGLETPEGWVESLVEVFREVRRVLRDDGTLWVEVGDSYAGQSLGYDPNAPRNQRRVAALEGGVRSDGAFNVSKRIAEGQPGRQSRMAPGLKQKDLVGAPWMLAFALRADGWWLRNDVVWAKPNPMPEAVTDRMTRSHSYVFLLTKSGAATFWTHRDGPGSRVKPKPDYRWVNEVTGEERVDYQPGEEWVRINLWRGRDYFYDADAIREDYQGYDGRSKTAISPQQHGGHENHAGREGRDRWPGNGRNARTVWTIATESFAGAHFATFPQELARKCIVAGSSERGACPSCGAPWTRQVKVAPNPSKWAEDDDKRGWPDDGSTANAQSSKSLHRNPGGVYRQAEATGAWLPTCGCDAGEPVPCVVLDPFMGSGTTALTAREQGRHAIGVELNEKYLHIAAERLQQLSLFA